MLPAFQVPERMMVPGLICWASDKWSPSLGMYGSSARPSKHQCLYICYIVNRFFLFAVSSTSSSSIVYSSSIFSSWHIFLCESHLRNRQWIWRDCRWENRTWLMILYIPCRGVVLLSRSRTSTVRRQRKSCTTSMATSKLASD